MYFYGLCRKEYDVLLRSSNLYYHELVQTGEEVLFSLRPSVGRHAHEL